MRRLLPAHPRTLLSGVLAAFLLGMTGCSDEPVSTSPGTDASSVTAQATGSDLSALDKTFGTSAETLFPAVDQNAASTGDEERRLNPDIIRRILNSLELTERQAAAIRHCFEEYRECINHARRAYNDALHGLREEFNAKVRRLRHAVEEGTISPERARAIYNELVTEYQRRAAALQNRYNAALRECLGNLLDCVRGYLTPRQLERFNHLLEEYLHGDGDGGRDN